jgi:DNA-binding NtrC family response regulator
MDGNSMHNILVIDENDRLRKTITEHLTLSGCQVIGVNNGNAGLEAISAQPFELVFLNLRLPSINQSLKTIHAIYALRPQMPIYILSAFHETYLNKLKTLNNTKINFNLLCKPMDPETLALMATSVLNKKIIEVH